jgi:hypothetical protein
MLLVRLGWSGTRHLASAGWALALIMLFLLVREHGAWGAAMGVTTGMIAALAIVLQAGWISPAREVRAPREVSASVSRPPVGADIMRRIAVFVVAVPIAFAAAAWLTFACQALVRGDGPVEANSVVLTWFLQPILWAAIMTWQMTRSGPAEMLWPAGVAAALGTAVWSIA